MSSDLVEWALPRLRRLLPIDDESLRAVITNSSSLSKSAGAEDLKNLLGDSAQALEFISGFNSRRPDVLPAPTQPPSSHVASSNYTVSDSELPKGRSKGPRKAKPPLHIAGPVRRPEGYGNVDGGYKKANAADDYLSSSRKNAFGSTSLSEALQLPKVTQGGYSPSPSSSRDHSPPRHKLPPSAAGNLISHMPNVRTKQSKKSAYTTTGTASPQKQTSVATTGSIADLTSAIAALELSTNPALSTGRRKCDCNASLHPLFTTAPNCLNCGKIICALEGLQPCSFCDSPILTRDQVNSMIRALKEERGNERMAVNNSSHSGRGTPMFASTPDSSGDEGATRARAHRDKLLAFQRDNVQRTKIHDEAADYDVTLTPGTTQWMSPMQRAAALKQQQKALRDMEEANKPEWERKRTVMSMSVRNGKLVRTYEKVEATANEEDVDESVVKAEAGDSGSKHVSKEERGAFSDNPLLADGKLIRPIWKAPDGEKGKGRASEGRKSVWRRVQDDNEDNEQWILDGGAHGFQGEGDDGSKNECG